MAGGTNLPLAVWKVMGRLVRMWAGPGLENSWAPATAGGRPKVRGARVLGGPGRTTSGTGGGLTGGPRGAARLRGSKMWWVCGGGLLD